MNADSKEREQYEIVGELILTASLLDYQLTELVIAAMHLNETPFLLPVLLTLDPSRKIEILKGRAKHISNADWKGAVDRYVDRFEKVYSRRNQACHMQIVIEKGEWLFKGYAAAKLFKGLDMEAEQLKPVTFGQLRDAIALGAEVFEEGKNVIANCQRLSNELKAKRELK